MVLRILHVISSGEGECVLCKERDRLRGMS